MTTTIQFNRFKKTDVSLQKKQAEQQQTTQSNTSSIFKPNTAIHKWENGKVYIRLVPQPVGSPFSWCVPISTFEIYEEGAPLRGAYLVGAEIDGGIQHPMSHLGQLENVRRLLYRHDRFKSRMRTRENPKGVSLNTKCRTLFLGFPTTNATTGNFKLEVFRLPSNYPNSTGPVQSGTRLRNFATEQDRNGGFKYGDITDISKGREISISTSNAGINTVSYDPSVEDRLELGVETEDGYNVDPLFHKVLSEIKTFDEYLNWPSHEEFRALIKYLLGQPNVDMYEYVAEQCGWNTKVEAPTEDKPF